MAKKPPAPRRPKPKPNFPPRLRIPKGTRIVDVNYIPGVEDDDRGYFKGKS